MKIYFYAFFNKICDSSLYARHYCPNWLEKYFQVYCKIVIIVYCMSWRKKLSHLLLNFQTNFKCEPVFKGLYLKSLLVFIIFISHFFLFFWCGRHLEHSTIIYEEANHTPLLRLAWNKQDPNYLSTFALDSMEVKK